MGESKIEWTRYTFNPWLGCAKVHAGCLNCYAMTEQAVVMRKGGRVKWGEVWQGGDRSVVADSTWQKPFTWARKAAKEGKREPVFCASLGDVLEVPEEPPVSMSAPERGRIKLLVDKVKAQLESARTRLWDTIRQTAVVGGSGPDEDPREVGYPSRAPSPWEQPGLDWLLLTKRPENWRLVPEDVRPLVWLGTSISDQKTADEFVPRLSEAEGFRYCFLSIEPLLGPIELRPFRVRWVNPMMPPRPCIDGVIVGGESGPLARPMDPAWVRSLRDQCLAAGVSFFFKQWGGRDKKAAGRDLDGRTWDQMPGMSDRAATAG